MLPNFFVVGTQKAGTTSIYAYLAQHPQVFMSPVKEPGHFAPEQCYEPHIFDRDEYALLFDGVTDEIAIGEASATYLWSETAPRAISERLPHAKIIIILRDPADRAYSQYLYMLSAGRTRRSFRQQIEISLKPAREQRFSVLWPFLELGFYHDQVARYLAAFPRSQIHIAYYEELQNAPARVMRELFAFLGVDPAFVADVREHHNVPQVPKMMRSAYFLKKFGLWQALGAALPARLRARLRAQAVCSRDMLTADSGDRAILVDYYREDVERLGELLQRDLSRWIQVDATQRSTADA